MRVHVHAIWGIPMLFYACLGVLPKYIKPVYLNVYLWDSHVTAQKLSLITHFFSSFVRRGSSVLKHLFAHPFGISQNLSVYLQTIWGDSIFMPTQMTQAPTQNSSVYLHIFLRTLYHLNTYLQAPLRGLPRTDESIYYSGEFSIIRYPYLLWGIPQLKFLFTQYLEYLPSI